MLLSRIAYDILHLPSGVPKAGIATPECKVITHMCVMRAAMPSMAGRMGEPAGSPVSLHWCCNPVRFATTEHMHE